MNKKTMVIGASNNPEKYSNLAIVLLQKLKHDVVAIGYNEGTIGNVTIVKGKPKTNKIDTISLYISVTVQKSYYDYIIGVQPKRIIFNPGTENEELSFLAEANGIEVLEACTLVMLQTGQY
jgi:uncharacterized protein